jgi:biopolymer transport protein TolQ
MESSQSIISMALSSGLVVSGVLLALIICSVACWAVIIYKFTYLRAAGKQNVAFLEIFWNTSNFQNTHDQTEKFKKSPLNQMFREGYREWKKHKPAKGGAASDDLAISSGSVESVDRSLRRSQDAEASKLESMLVFLATLASAAPFVGLFGTVWGIMESFRDIGAMGSANLAVVAPGISEALIATATGLAAAIPAVVAYNYFNNEIKAMTTEMEGFRAEFLNIVVHFENGRR